MDTANLDEVSSAISPMTKLVWMESPTNPRQQISDIRVSHFYVEMPTLSLQFSVCLYFELLGLV